MKTIHYGTKEENNLRRVKEFLKLSPSQRVIRFIQLSKIMALYETKKANKSNNFILTKS